MPQNTQADVFINTLAELVAAERERRADRLRLQHKANADRFMRAFRTEFNNHIHISEWNPHSQQTLP